MWYLDNLNVSKYPKWATAWLKIDCTLLVGFSKNLFYDPASKIQELEVGSDSTFILSKKTKHILPVSKIAQDLSYKHPYVFHPLRSSPLQINCEKQC